jgi:uncharacterized protein YgiM (DUF1202 family)
MAKRKTKPAAEQSFAKHVVLYPQGLNLRAGPGTQYDVLRVLKAGEEVQQDGEIRDEWMQVEGGWIDSRYVQEV